MDFEAIILHYEPRWESRPHNHRQKKKKNLARSEEKTRPTA